MDSGTLAIIAAVWTEAKPIVQRLGLAEDDRTFADAPAWARDRGGDRITLITTGMGRRRAAAATADLVERLRPGRVLVVGLAGALSRDLRVADLVRPDEVIDTTTGHVHRRSSPLDGARGRLVTIDHVAATPEAKRTLHEQHDAIAVDMETAAVVGVCEAHATPWACLRVIGDTAEQTLPAWLATCVDGIGQPRAAMAAAQLLAHPLDLGRLIRTGRHAARAARALADALPPLIDKFPG